MQCIMTPEIVATNGISVTLDVIVMVVTVGS